MSVVDQLEVFELELSDVCYVWVELKVRERVRISFELSLQRFDMVRVHVRVPKRVNELPPLQATNLSQHARQQSIARNVEWHSEPEVAGALVHLARQPAIRHVKLGKYVARRESHFREGCRIPSCHENSPARWVLLELFNQTSKLINALTFVVVVHGLVGRPEVSPLETVNRSQVPLLPLG